MSSGNTYGLAGINHYGSMQRVGGKAAGFINKKFFHPSSLRNQEKLWMALTADETERKKQDEMDKRRAEEMQVEELRKQMYLAGQATKGSDILGGSSGSRACGAAGSSTKEQREAFEQQQRRRLQLKEERFERAARGELEGSPPPEDEDECAMLEVAKVPEAEMLAGLAKSKYQENVHIRGHEAVWGSWFALEDKRWGYGCCKTLDHKKRCPHGPEEEEEDKVKAAKGERGQRAKRRRRGGAAKAEAAGEAEAAEAAPELAGNSSAAASSAATSTAPAAPDASVTADVQEEPALVADAIAASGSAASEEAGGGSANDVEAAVDGSDRAEGGAMET